MEWRLRDQGLVIPIVAALVLSNGFNATSVLLVFGFGTVHLLGLIPYPVLGVMLGVVGAPRAWLRAVSCRPVAQGEGNPCGVATS